MAEIKIINDDAANHRVKADIIMTDPPFDMPAKTLKSIIDNYESDHLILITTMHQLIDFMKITDWKLSFDFVIDGVVPKKSLNIRQPNYVHATGAYLTKGKKSLFNRKHRQRSDVYENNGFWPTIFHAPRNTKNAHGHAKNMDAFTDILGSFEVNSVVDMFAGGGTTGIAAYMSDIDCTLIEKDENNCKKMREILRFVGARI